MFRHVVVFTWKPEATAEQRQSAVDGIREWGTQCAASGYGTLTVGVDARIDEGNADCVVVADLVDRDAYLAYRDDDRHRAMIAERIAPIRASRTAVQHEL